MEEHMWWCGNETGEAHEVGLKKPNRWDLFDMHGNAWEWCEDDWHPNYNGAPTDGRAWMDSPRNIIRVTRGGTWSSFAKGCRSADRNDYIASGYYGDVGLRLVRTVEEVSAVEEAEQL